MHESTISRVTTNKYVHTPQGIFELKYFFNSSIRRTSEEDIASESVKNKIKEIVGNEDQRHPLSDQKIVQLLREGGIVIARRDSGQVPRDAGDPVVDEEEEVFSKVRVTRKEKTCRYP